jgi:hypothetical protein
MDQEIDRLNPIACLQNQADFDVAKFGGQHCDTSEELVERIRKAHACMQEMHRRIQAAESDALENALNAGADIVELCTRDFSMSWISERCDIRQSTAYLYRRLAEHRDEIEAARRKKPHLSLRGARDLIREPRDPKSNPKITPDPKPKPAATPEQVAITMAEQWDDATWTAVLQGLPFDRFRKVMPGSLRDEIQEHIDALLDTEPVIPGKAIEKLTKAVKRAIGLAANMVEPGASPAAISANKFEAMGVLESINSMLTAAGTDLHHLAVSVAKQPTFTQKLKERKKSRRAA